MDRLNQLKQFYNEDQEDPFNLYALALEWSKSNPHKGIELFRQLHERHPQYVPTYYQLALLLIANNQSKEAVVFIEEGIEIAIKQNDSKSAGELRNLLEED